MAMARLCLTHDVKAGQPNLLKLLQSPIEQPYDIYILLHQNVSKPPKNACFNEFKGNYN